MSDHTSETIQQIQSRQDSEAAYVRDYILGGQGLCFDEDSIPLILNHIDSFISQSRDDVYVQKVFGGRLRHSTAKTMMYGTR
jgi:hypothetical protein